MSREASQIQLLEEAYPDAKYYLDFTTPWELVIATILSAQCTDIVVNRTTPGLFRKYPRPKDILDADEEILAKEISSVTYAKSKAQYLKKTARIIIEEFGGEIPKGIDDLTRLSGVGKKTANAIQQNAFGMVNGIVVDTHVIRISRRIGWTGEKNPERIEDDLMRTFPKGKWSRIPHLLKSHGQKICTARNPKCFACILKEDCPSAFKA